LKTSEGESPPRVRISPPPPITMRPPEELGVEYVNFMSILFSLDLDLGLQDRVVHSTELLDKLALQLENGSAQATKNPSAAATCKIASFTPASPTREITSS